MINWPALLQAARGPIMLMTFGGLMALHQSQAVSFERTWPVLIIVYGLMKLLERLFVRPPVAGGMS